MIVPKGFKKTAGYHTHPDPGAWGEGFSPGDINWATAKRMTPVRRDGLFRKCPRVCAGDLVEQHRDAGLQLQVHAVVRSDVIVRVKTEGGSVPLTAAAPRPGR